MGIAEIRDAFQSAVQPMYSCTEAFQCYVREHDAEMQVLDFKGISADGKPFSVSSDPHRPSDDPNQVARETALKFLQAEPST